MGSFDVTFFLDKKSNQKNRDWFFCNKAKERREAAQQLRVWFKKHGQMVRGAGNLVPVRPRL